MPARKNTGTVRKVGKGVLNSKRGRRQVRPKRVVVAKFNKETLKKPLRSHLVRAINPPSSWDMYEGSEAYHVGRSLGAA